MKNKIIFSMFLTILFLPVAYAMAGSGTPADQYQITTCQELQDIINDLDAH